MVGFHRRYRYLEDWNEISHTLHMDSGFHQWLLHGSVASDVNTSECLTLI